MAVAIRLMRIGKKGFPNYRIIAVDQRKKRDGAYLDSLGFYNPLVQPPKLEINQEKFTSWREKGAVLSEGMEKLLKQVKTPKKGSV